MFIYVVLLLRVFELKGLKGESIDIVALHELILSSLH